MCSGKAAHAPRFVRCQSIRQRPPVMGTQKSFFSGVPLAWCKAQRLSRRTRECATNRETRISENRDDDRTRDRACSGKFQRT